ncbi:hypothetical protein F4782DRAFT_535117 [Xylaria castorea]|nr:hypothetical protein F4782DRAFT_535117 [Xylaria castorea]
MPEEECDLPRWCSVMSITWITVDLMIGAKMLAEDANRGDQLVPGVVHWASDAAHKPWPCIGRIMFYPTTSTITAEATAEATAKATANRLLIAYPNTTQEGTDVFTFAVTGIPPK